MSSGEEENYDVKSPRGLWASRFCFLSWVTDTQCVLYNNNGCYNALSRIRFVSFFRYVVYLIIKVYKREIHFVSSFIPSTGMRFTGAPETNFRNYYLP